MKIVTIVGARPQFIKAAAVSRVLRQTMREILIHTGQHYDKNMSDVFFDEIGIPAPDHNLRVGSGSHAAQTASMLTGIDAVLLAEKPDWVLVYGDTNSTLAGALAAAKRHIPVAHVEAGLRSFNRRMPEEINRVVTDHLSALLLCPSRSAVKNLAKEGIVHGVHPVGDVMADALDHAVKRAAGDSTVLDTLGVRDRPYLLATVHRAENTDDPIRLKAILGALQKLSEQEPVVFPVHPRTRKRLMELGIANPKSRETRDKSKTCPAFRGIPPSAGQVQNLSRVSRDLKFTDPLGYLDMVRLEKSARMILTDSGGIQKEAYWLGVPCVTLRDETEWTETVLTGWNTLTGASTAAILHAVHHGPRPKRHPALYGDGHAASRCVKALRTADVRGQRSKGSEA
ncbi:MAG: UDP-N-acetylglucosamine 2-epimerase (non-hydrolyzing) [Lentisphaerae bacterium]|nr:UDP-N-acetylglucosamine 2-epimerase (non-hydrolyzing) [Lentisphaerota bacterium]